MRRHHRRNPLELEWGYRRFPESVKAVWGARAILEERGADIVYQSMDNERTPAGEAEKAKLVAGLDGDPRGTGAIHHAQREIKRLLKSGGLYLTPHSGQISRTIEDRGQDPRTPGLRGSFYRDTANEYILADYQGIIVAGNTQASHGYIYLVGFVKPDNFEISMVCESCRLKPVDFDDALCGGCQKRLCSGCANNECPECENVKCRGCRAQAPKCNNCEEIICNSEQCLENAMRCEGCENYLCAECAEDIDDNLCQECNELTCAGCEKNLYATISPDRVKHCENCERLMHPRCYKASELCKDCGEDQEESEEDGYDSDSEEDSDEDSGEEFHRYYRNPVDKNFKPGDQVWVTHSNGIKEARVLRTYEMGEFGTRIELRVKGMIGTEDNSIKRVWRTEEQAKQDLQRQKLLSKRWREDLASQEFSEELAQTHNYRVDYFKAANSADEAYKIHQAMKRLGEKLGVEFNGDEGFFENSPGVIATLIMAELPNANTANLKAKSYLKRMGKDWKIMDISKVSKVERGIHDDDLEERYGKDLPPIE